MFGSASETGHKEMFLITLVETIINVFPDILNNFLNKPDVPLSYMI